MDIIDGSVKNATLSVRIPKIWLQGALILENSRDLVIPACQGRAIWAGFTTCNAEPGGSKIVIAWPGLIPFQKNRPGSEWGSVASKKSNFFLDIYPGTLASIATPFDKQISHNGACQIQ